MIFRPLKIITSMKYLLFETGIIPTILSMKKTGALFLLFTIIIIEGYIVLSTELLAIRQSIPYVGSGTDTVSIIIAAVLMPLAFGYYAGGRFKSSSKHPIRKKLLFNILISQTILLPGISYAFLGLFFGGLLRAGIDNRLIMTALYSAIFLITPVYLLGQTIPLVSNYFTREKLAMITGRMLFFSTLGSFMGAVISTLVLMSTVGVHNTASLTLILLSALMVLLSKNKTSEPVLLSLTIGLAAILINSNAVMTALKVVENNKYNTVLVAERNGERHMILNNNASSMYSATGRKHPYIEFVQKQTIEPIMNASPPKEILVIGAGAFTFGLEDKTNHYDFVDIDSSLKDIAEHFILKQKLTDNKIFHPVPARAYLTATDKKYDVIFLDAYLGDVTLPEHLVTVEFFKQVKAHLKDDGKVAANFILSPNFENAFSRHVDNTFRAVFPNVSREVMGGDYMLWNENTNAVVNVIYLYKNHLDEDNAVYTDDKNRVFLEKPKRKR